MVICLEQGADLHIVQLMPLPLTVSCFSKIQVGFTFLVPAHPGSSGQRAVKQVWHVLVKTAGVVPEVCSRTDAQTDRYTHKHTRSPQYSAPLPGQSNNHLKHRETFDGDADAGRVVVDAVGRRTAVHAAVINPRIDDHQP